MPYRPAGQQQIHHSGGSGDRKRFRQAFPGDAGYGIGKQHHRQGDLDHHPGNSVQSCFVQDSALYGCHTNGPVNYKNDQLIKYDLCILHEIILCSHPL